MYLLGETVQLFLKQLALALIHPPEVSPLPLLVPCKQHTTE